VRILYGVCGEGMGHATRSDVIARHLASRGHSLQFVCSQGRALDYLRSRWGAASVREVPGFHLVVENSRVMLTRTLLENAVTHLASSAAHALSIFGVTEPDIVIDDFCAWTARYAKLMSKPLVAIDNIHFMTRCHHPQEWIDAHQNEAAAAMLVTQMTVPEAHFYFVLSFTRMAPACQPLTGLQLPVVRDVIASQPRSDEGHLVAYFNERAAWSSILAILHRAGRPVRAYGCPGVTARSVTGSVTLCPLSEEELARDLASSSAVVSGAGFSLISEALALRKPLFAVPYAGSFEQILNGRYLDREGYGTWATSLTDEGLGRFLEHLGPMRERLQQMPSGNEPFFADLDRLLEAL
jgi:uncharacterized protein (TIGR00661 family)